MKITSGNLQKDVEVLKHFKIHNDEYILYKNTGGISVGLIQTNNIVAPPADKLDVLLKSLGNLLSSTPVEAINLANGCDVLSNIIENPLVEVSYQNVNLSEEQIKNATSSQTPVVNEVANPTSESVSKEKKEEKVPTSNKMKIYGIIIVVLTIVLVVLLFKDKLFGGSSSSGTVTPTPPSIQETPIPQTTSTIDNCTNCVFGYYEDNKYFFGQNRVIYSNYVNNYQDLVDESGSQRVGFLGHILSSDGLIDNGFACGLENGNVFCLEGSTDGTKYDINKEILNRVFDATNCVEENNSYICTGSIKASLYMDGNVKVEKDNYECQVYNNGSMMCANK